MFIEVVDKLFAFVFLADGLSVHLHHLFHGRSPWNIGVGHDGSDLGQRVVVLLRQARVGGQNDVRLGIGDLLEGDAVGFIEKRRGFSTELL